MNEFPDFPDFPNDDEKNEGEIYKEDELIKHIRQEAYALRDCFARYSFQAIAAACAILILIARFQTDIPFLGLLGFVPAILLYGVLSMGLHKYAGSNRLLGYELYLERMRHFNERWRRLTSNVGWEEAMRAWRIVQPTLRNEIYRPSDHWPWRIVPRFLSPRLCPTVVKPIKRSNDPPLPDPAFLSGEFWFDPRESIKDVLGMTERTKSVIERTSKVIYEADGYLETMSYVFTLLILASCLISGIAVLHIWMVNDTPKWANILASVYVCLGVVIAGARWLNVKSKIEVLEHGIQSIHASSIIWEATIIAHLLALKAQGLLSPSRDQVKTMHGYTTKLAAQVQPIAEQARNLHRWIYFSRLTLFEDEDGSGERDARRARGEDRRQTGERRLAERRLN